MPPLGMSLPLFGKIQHWGGPIFNGPDQETLLGW
jgi:hypothetical protein